MPSYLNAFLNVPQKIASLTNTITLFGMMGFYLASGWLSDRVGYRRLMVLSIGISLLSLYALFLGLQGKSYGILLGIQLLFGLLLSGIDPLITQYLGDTFPRNLRASGMSFSLSLTASLF